MPDPRASHATHDTLLIAALAADDLTGAARSDAETRLAACPDCAALHADLVAIAAATTALPMPARPRSFTLAPEQAARLAPSPWRRLVAGVRSPTGFARPLAATFTTLGIAGLLLTTLPSMASFGVLGGSSAAMPASTTGPSDSSAEAQRDLASPTTDRYDLHAAGQSPDPVAPGAVPVPSGAIGATSGGGKGSGNGSGPGVVEPPASTVPGPPAAGQGSPDAAIGNPSPAYGAYGGGTATSSPTSEPVPPAEVAAAATTTADTGRPWLLVLSLALLGIGLGLFAARRVGRSD